MKLQSLSISRNWYETDEVYEGFASFATDDGHSLSVKISREFALELSRQVKAHASGEVSKSPELNDLPIALLGLRLTHEATSQQVEESPFQPIEDKEDYNE